MGGSMQGIILDILQRMKSASHSAISARVVISTRRLDAHHLGIGVSKGRGTDKNRKLPEFPPMYIPSRITFSLHSSIISFRTSDQIISASLLSTWMRCFYSRADELGSSTRIYVGKIACFEATLRDPHCRQQFNVRSSMLFKMAIQLLVSAAYP